MLRKAPGSAIGPAGVSSAADGTATAAADHEEVQHPAMAKRVRGSSRPGQRRPTVRRTTTPAARPATPAASPSVSTPSTTSTTPAARASGLTDAELARAAELEAQMLAEEKAAETARRRSQDRAVTTREGAGARAIRPEDEYAYVARDLRDIVRIATLLLAILFALWIVIDVMGVVSIV